MEGCHTCGCNGCNTISLPTLDVDQFITTIVVDATFTGAPGTDASVVNTGTDTDVHLVFTIPAGEQGDPGTPGTPGTNGTNGTPGTNGTNGTPGTNGTDGIAATITVGTVTTGPSAVVNSGTTTAAVLDFTLQQGPSGAPGAPGLLLDYANFYAMQPNDNPATIAVGAAILFPQIGPAATGTGITALTASTFNLAVIGNYEINYQSSIDEAGQLCVMVNGLLYIPSVAGRATGTSQISNDFFLTTTVINTVISVNNPAGNAAALTITPIAGGTHAVSSQLVVKRMS